MTAWTDKLKAYQKEHNCSYKEAMIKCSSGKTKKRVRKPKKEIELDGDGLALGDAERSASLRKLLQEHGYARVIKITVLRTAVQSRTLLNIISLGQFQKNVDALGYDKIFHILTVLRSATTLESEGRFADAHPPPRILCASTSQPNCLVHP